ncbi:MAG: UbiA family prenyltransferase [Nitrospinae bacterium]|nr:UbiA family prenyltransferase [Nitrospinota bacterium]
MQLSLILKDIKIEHTLFAMPFAIMGAFIAAGGLPHTGTLALLLLALVFARSSAMAFNRLADARFDKTNPRTQNRPLAQGKAKTGAYAAFVVISSASFIGVCYFINPLAFLLSPLALAVVLFYSLTKRFTAYSHLFLGVALALAPIGAWIAVTGRVETAPLVLGGAVVFWLVGLDIIYSCQDVEHDKGAGLFSIPSRFGVARALSYSAMAHVVMVSFLVSLFFISDLGLVYLLGVVLTAALLWYEHRLVRPDDLRRVNTAFFNVNGLISVGLMAFTIVDRLLT